MHIINIHKRTISEPIESISSKLDSLSSDQDMIWPHELWPAMRFRGGLAIGNKGGHGPIRYRVVQYLPGSLIEFEFLAPRGFNGVHRFELSQIDDGSSELKHTIDMNLSGTGVLVWYAAILWLHDALLEDCLDKIENQSSAKHKSTPHSLWVKLLRSILKKKR